MIQTYDICGNRTSQYRQNGVTEGNPVTDGIGEML